MMNIVKSQITYYSVDRVTDINQFFLEEETKPPIDSSFEEELFNEEFSCDDLSYPRK